MQRVFEFLKSTIVGGLLVLVPLGLLAFVAVKAFEIARDAASPVLAALPVRSVGGVSLAVLLAVVALLALCFFAGLVARTTLTRRLVKGVENLVLTTVPGYALMKNVGENLVGVEGADRRKTVVVRFEASSRVGFWMDTLPDGRVVVFLPNAPNAMTGELHLCPPDRVEVLEVSITAALDCLGCLGIGFGTAWPKADAAR